MQGVNPAKVPEDCFCEYFLPDISGHRDHLIMQFAFTKQFGIIMGGGYAAFIQNLVMSLLYICMLRRKEPEGQ